MYSPNVLLTLHHMACRQVSDELVPCLQPFAKKINISENSYG